MQQKIFCLILNFKNYQQSLDCLNKLKSSDAPKGTKYILIDNTPKKDEEFLSRFTNLSNTTVIRSPKNLGFAAGNNQGIKLALKRKATHILIINPDVTVPKKFFSPLLKDFAKDPSFGLVAPAIKHYQNKHLRYGLEGQLDWLLTKATHVNLIKKPTPTLRPAPFVTFACVLIKSSVFTKVGLLDDRFFMYLEDVDYCLRASKKSFTLAVDPSVTVSHLTSSSFSNPVAKLPISFVSQIKFINKWLPFPKNIIPILYNSCLYTYLFFLWEYQFIKRQLK